MNLKSKIYFFLLVIISFSCLDDNFVPVDKIKLNGTAEILRYLESTGDFANTDLAPALVFAQEIFTNKEHYFILDIRDHQKYLSGHIDGAINISPKILYEKVDSLYNLNPSKYIAIISQNGQASSYFTCLLRLAGFNNVYTLNYGMASWNIEFANEWFSALGDNNFLYNDTIYQHNSLTNLPEIKLPSTLISGKEKTIYRIKQIINADFLIDINYFENLESNDTIINYLVCYGEGRLYNAPQEFGNLGHPKNTVWFQNTPVFEFRSINNLQTLPTTDQPIIIYSGDGQLSACLVGYLRVLGYDAKTLLFGANQLFYYRLTNDIELTEHAFSIDDIMNYPYITDN